MSARLSSLLSCVELVFESEHALEQALVTCEESGADFGECLHLGLAAQADALPFRTLDVKSAKLRGLVASESERAGSAPSAHGLAAR